MFNGQKFVKGKTMKFEEIEFLVNAMAKGEAVYIIEKGKLYFNNGGSITIINPDLKDEPTKNDVNNQDSIIILDGENMNVTKSINFDDFVNSLLQSENFMLDGGTF